MVVEIDREDLKEGVLGLAMTIVEIIRDALRVQAIRRIEAGGLTDLECERLGSALRDLDSTIDSIKREQGLEEAVRSIREGLDDAVDQVVRSVVSGDLAPGRASTRRKVA